MHKHTQFIMQLFTLYTDSDRKQVFVEEYPETGSIFLLEEFKPTARWVISFKAWDVENAISSVFLSLPSHGNAAVASLGKNRKLHCLERKHKSGVSGYEEAA